MGDNKIDDERIIDAITKVRTKNNILWMDLLRLAMREAPEEAKKIFKDIQRNDSLINEYSKELVDE